MINIQYIIKKSTKLILQAYKKAVSFYKKRQDHITWVKKINIKLRTVSRHICRYISKNHWINGVRIDHALPWYLFLGETASGKTQLINHFQVTLLSPKHFDSSNKKNQELHIYAADTAVLLDTGSYVWEPNNPAWKKDLQKICRYCRRSGLAEIIWTVDIVKLQKLNQDDINKYVEKIHFVYQQLTKKLGFIAPVQLVFTHCDHLYGFHELALYLHQKHQVMSLEINEDIESDWQRMLEHNPIWIDQQLCQIVSLSERFKVFLFFQELKTISPNIKELLSKTNKKNNKGNKIYTKRITFANATNCENKFTFMQEKSLSSRYAIRNKYIKRAFILLFISIFFILTIVDWYQSYSRMNDWQKESIKIVKNYNKLLDQGNVSRSSLISAQFDLLQQLHKTLHIRHFWWFNMGLSNISKEKSLLSSILTGGLYFSLIKPAGLAIGNRLQVYNHNWRDSDYNEKLKHYNDYYQSLKSYLLLAKNNQHQNLWLDANYIAQVLLQSNNLNLNITQLTTLIEYYLAQDNTGVSNDELSQIWLPKLQLIKVARSQLHHAIDPIIIYHKLKQQWSSAIKNVNSHTILYGPGKAFVVVKQPLSLAYTIHGWESIVKPALIAAARQYSHGDWVLTGKIELSQQANDKAVIIPAESNPALEQRILCVLIQQYRADYFSHWLSWMRQIQVGPFLSLTDAKNAWLLLSSPNNAWLNLLNFIKNNFIFHDLTLGDRSQLLLKIFSDKQVNHYSENVKELPHFLSNILTHHDNQIFINKLVLTTLDNKNTALVQLKEKWLKKMPILDKGMKESVENILLQPIISIWQVLLLQAGQSIQQQWLNSIWPIYKNGIFAKAPFFHSRSDANTSVPMLRNLLANNTGILWQFVKKQLSHYIYQQHGTWFVKKWLGNGIQFNPGFLLALNQAEKLKNSWLSANSKVQYSLQFYPEVNPKIAIVRLRINNKTIWQYRNGPLQWQTVNWHFQGLDSIAKLQLLTADKQIIAEDVSTGQWAFWRLLQQAKIQDYSNNNYLLIWKLKTNNGKIYHFTVHVRNNSPINLMPSLLINLWQLPNNILQ